MSLSKTLLSLSIVAALSASSPMLFAQGKTIAQPKAKAFSISNIDFDTPTVEGAIEENFEDEDFDESLEDFYGDEDFVSIATGNKTLIHKAPSTATVITALEIQQMGAVEIDEVLETVAGLHVSYKNGTHFPLYTFRGIYSGFNQQVLMLINGVPITNIFTGNRSQVWGGMTVESIARIEVIRGPGSAIYGADASSGVINIVTKSGGAIKGSEIGYRKGSFSTDDFWLTHGWEMGDLTGFFSYERHKTDGYELFVDIDGQSFLDSVFGTNASLAPGFAGQFKHNDELRLKLDYQAWQLNLGYQKRRIDVGLGIGEAIGPGTDEFSDRWNADISYETTKLIENWKISTRFSYFSTTQEFDSNLIIFPAGADIGLGGPFPEGVIGNPEVFEKHYRTGIVARNESMTDHDWTIGFGHNISDLYKVKESKNFAFGPDGEYLPPGSPIVDVTDTDFVFLPEDDRRNNYLFIQDIWHLAKDWELTTGIRYDDYSDFGSTINPRVALVWTTSINLTSKFLYGSAFRAPSFAEMRNINNPTNLGNPDLNPETIDTFELAFDYHPYSGLNYGVSFFRYDWQDIIRFTPDQGATTKTAQNIGEQQAYGFEVEFDYSPINSLNLSGNYSWLNAEDGNNNAVSSIPEQQIYLRVSYQINENFKVSAKSNWVMNRVRAHDDLRADIDDYTITDFSLTWQPQASDISLSWIVKNVFDSDAREPTTNKGAVVNVPNDLPLPGRTIYGEFRYQF
jgi:iron complex outermembrane receptor protein